MMMVAFSGVAIAQDYSNQHIKLNTKAPELAFPNPAGETLKLTEINKGRYVLLDFWASWCGPCRRASPELVALYKEYKDACFADAPKGFTIVSVSLDKNKEAWVAAIGEDSLSWAYHMSDLGAWGSQSVKTYGIEYIPQAFLLDPNGKVIGKYNFASLAGADLKGRLKKKS